MDRYYVGLDLGQSRDHTAIAVVQRAELKGGWDGVAYAWKKVAALRLRYLERMPLGITYPEMVDRVREVVEHRELAGRCTLVVDGTGVGRPVVDLLHDARFGCNILPVTITGGDAETSIHGYYGVPKRDLITNLQVLLQQKKLQVAADLEHGPLLVKEMSEMQVRITPAGRELYGTWREGQHDDLTFAVALACWWVGKEYGRQAAGEAGYWCWAGQAEWEKGLRQVVGEMQSRLPLWGF
jgi:hypothetical protein